MGMLFLKCRWRFWIFMFIFMNSIIWKPMTNWRSLRSKLNNTRPSQNRILISSNRRIWRPRICVFFFIGTATKQMNPILLWKKYMQINRSNSWPSSWSTIDIVIKFNNYVTHRKSLMHQMKKYDELLLN